MGEFPKGIQTRPLSPYGERLLLAMQNGATVYYIEGVDAHYSVTQPGGFKRVTRLALALRDRGYAVDEGTIGRKRLVLTEKGRQVVIHG